MDLGGQEIVCASYDAVRSRVNVELDSGLEFSFPTSGSERLHGADVEALSNVEVMPARRGLYWPALDEHLSLGGLLAGSFGARAPGSAR